MIHHARTYLALSLIAGAAQLAGCLEPADREAEDSSTLEAAGDHRTSATADLEASTLVESVGPGCGTRYTQPIPETQASGALTLMLPQATAASCPPADIYFHPNNGAHGGWIESWRVCNLGGGQYQICAGGSAPVRFFNPSSCNGTVYDFYPQGWHGHAQTFGGCCTF